MKDIPYLNCDLKLDNVFNLSEASTLTDTVDDLPHLGVIQPAAGQHPISYYGDEHREQPHAQVWEGRHEAVL